MPLTVSLGQMDIALGQPQANLETAQLMAAEAARRGSDVLVLPELWSTAYDLEQAGAHATGLEGGIFAETAAMARRHDLAIVGSCLSLQPDGHYANTAVLFGPDGAILGHYSKMHLFRLMQEEQYLTAGQALGLVETPWGPTGLAICYDLRFPELFRHYALAGARLILIPAEWPAPRLAHWQTLLRARAIENQLFVVACNRVGQSKGQHFFGHSAIIDPWGELVVEGGDQEMVLTASVDLNRVDEVRAQIPVFADRRADLYKL